ncbi:hypothetical protein BD324DRAFT_326629 [Kockovaella imperatae]|uniref:Tho complex subunit 7-domain-containing protein n=1 Tax=Kockovaella imperatae TaxID=4999 RepID=A0A1Y1UPF7_9TREE|nr:hypothetical protein BD324DRAFT_326629 [Kockovaella imperatae]ORX39346.1 hypothetical protein BD324DRAFT_326629 [Kockovaella imperatae]
MTDKIQIIPLTEDALNRYRITHPDRDLRPLLRRLHRLGAFIPSSDDPASRAEHEREVEMCKLELIKWRSGIQRIMGTVENLNRQRLAYLERAKETVERTEELRATLDSEKILLARRRRERDEQIKCDEVAAKITAKGKTRLELDEQISSLQQSLADHKASHELYTQTVQARVDLFSQITALVDEVRNTKLPIDPQASLEEVPPEEEGMDVDDSSTAAAAAAASSSSARLNASALPFQPTKSSTSATSAPSTRNTSPVPTGSSMKPPPASHGLPTRPSRSAGTTSLSASNHKIPSRPSTLRSVTTPVAGSLEEGELGAEEEGEVNEDARGSKRSAATESRSRSTRARR